MIDDRIIHQESAMYLITGSYCGTSIDVTLTLYSDRFEIQEEVRPLVPKTGGISITIYLEDIVKIKGDRLLHLVPFCGLIIVTKTKTYRFGGTLTTIWRPIINNAIQEYKLSQKTIKEEESKAIQQQEEKAEKLLEAEKLFNQALIELEKQNYDNAKEAIEKAINIKSNNKYAELKATILQQQSLQENSAPCNYQNGLEALEICDFAKAIQYLQKACEIDPTNQKYQEALERAKLGKVDIKTCSKKTLMSFDCIDEQKAQQIIEARDNGIMWHDYDEFGEYFNFQPHQLIELEEKIIFPLKKASKMGRKLDL